MAAKIEREFISARTKEALSQRKAKGIKLDAEREKIINYLEKRG